jgi:hypothetical protein
MFIIKLIMENKVYVMFTGNVESFHVTITECSTVALDVLSFNHCHNMCEERGRGLLRK